MQITDPIGITSVAFSVSGRLLFAGYDDFECKVRSPHIIIQSLVLGDGAARHLAVILLYETETDSNALLRFGTFCGVIGSERCKATKTESVAWASAMMP